MAGSPTGGATSLPIQISADSMKAADFTFRKPSRKAIRRGGWV